MEISQEAAHGMKKALLEFIGDVEAVGTDYLTDDSEESWPDLYETYKNAKAAIVATN